MTTYSIVLIAAIVAAEKPRNPFAVNDVVDPFNDTVLEFARGVDLKGDDDDVNATEWTPKPVIGNPMHLDGDWFGRWNNSGTGGWHKGTAKIKEEDDRIFILYREAKGTIGYLIEVRKGENGKLVGAYTTVGSTSGTSPWVGRLVDGERIDGMWSSSGGRWDFRRRAVRKLPDKDRPK